MKASSSSRTSGALCLALLLITLFYLTVVGGLLLQQLREWPTLHQDRDFAWYYLSAGRVLRGEDFYSGLQQEAARALGIQDYFIDVAVSPPTFPLLIAPLALLPYPAAWLSWQMLSLLALGLSIFWIVRELRLSLNLPGWLCLCCGILLFPPLGFHMVYAHTELFMLLLITGGWLGLRRDRDLLAGGLLGLAAVLRLYPAFLLLHLLLRRRWKALAASAGAGLGLALAAGLVAGPTAYLRYLSVLRQEVAVFYPRWGNLSLWGSVHKIASAWPALGELPALRDGLALLLSLGILALTLWLTRGAGRPSRGGGPPYPPAPVGAAAKEVNVGAGTGARPVGYSAIYGAEDLDYALFIVAALLASPLSWIYYQVLLYLPLLILLARLRREPSRALLAATLGILLTALLPLLSSWPNLPRAVELLLAFSGTLTLLGTYATLHLARRLNPPNPPPAP